MAIVSASVPTAIDYETRREYIQNALASVGANSLQELKMNWNSDLNTVLIFQVLLSPQQGASINYLKIYEQLFGSGIGLQQVNTQRFRR